MREPSNLPPGVTDRMIEEQQADPFDGTPYADRAHGLMAASEALYQVVFQLSMHRRWGGCAVTHPVDCPWPERVRVNVNLEERTRGILQKIDAELAEIMRMVDADGEESRG